MRGPNISSLRCSLVMCEILRISSSSSFNSKNPNLSDVSQESSNLLFSCVIIKIELYTSRSVNPIIQSSLISIGGVK